MDHTRYSSRALKAETFRAWVSLTVTAATADLASKQLPGGIMRPSTAIRVGDHRPRAASIDRTRGKEQAVMQPVPNMAALRLSP